MHEGRLETIRKGRKHKVLDRWLQDAGSAPSSADCDGRWEPLFEPFPVKPIRRILLRATARSNPKGGKRNVGGRGMYTRSDRQCVPTPYSSTAFPQTRAAAYQFSPFVGEPGRCATACGGGEAAGGGANDVRCGRASFRDGSAKSVDVCGPVVCVDRGTCNVRARRALPVTRAAL